MSFDSEMRELHNQRQNLESQRVDAKRRFDRDMEAQTMAYNALQKGLSEGLYGLSLGLDGESARTMSTDFQKIMGNVSSAHRKELYAMQNEFESSVSEIKRQDRRIEDDMFTVRRKYR